MIALFSHMTNDEKFDLLSNNFRQIWYRVYANEMPKDPYNNKFNMARRQFEDNFTMDGGGRLRELINVSHVAARVWEIPKGRKNDNEDDLHCAVREFQEETGISKEHIKLFPWAFRRQVYTDEGCQYANTYYIAMTDCTDHTDIRLDFQSAPPMEIGEIKWANIEEVRIMDPSGKLERLIHPILNFAKKNK
jgi:8-oxo-dGTP pyrophosphatase MutT (NUDIX family)